MCLLLSIIFTDALQKVTAFSVVLWHNLWTMICKTLSYGNEGWDEKIRIVEKIISSRPHAPYIYNDILILVPSSRMKRMYGRLFLDALQRLRNASALVQPEVLTLHQFSEKLYARLNGPRLIDENSRLILLEGLVKERLTHDAFFSQSPDLLAPSLSSALAAMIEQLSDAGVSPEDLALKIKGAEFSDKPQVRLLLDAYARYQAALGERGLTDPAGMRSRLVNAFEPAWLAPYRELIIDGLQDSGKLDTALLRKTAAARDCTYLIDAPSPELLNRAHDVHPLGITRDFILDAGLFPVKEGIIANSDNLFLASALFSDKTFAEAAKDAPPASSFSKRINLLSAVNTREEVSLIAGMVKTSVKIGIPPDSILVSFPTLDEYGPLVEEIFTDYGIPYNRALGRQLSSSPVATSLVALLRACQEDFSGPSLLRIFSSPFLKFAAQPALAPSLDRFMREKRIIGGKEKILTTLKRALPKDGGPDLLTSSLNELFTALAPFANRETARLGVWMERLGRLIAWSGLAEGVAAVHGPLNINLQAYRKLNETLASLGRAAKLFSEYTYTFDEWLFLLKKNFMHTRFQVPPEDEGGVQILGLAESVGRPWREIYLGGLAEGKFPQRVPQNIFLPEQTLEALGVRTLRQARLRAAHHFYRILLSADQVTLTRPENEGDRPVAPSPFIAELTPLRKAGLLNQGREKTSGLQFSLKVEESRSVPELMKALGVSANAPDSRQLMQSGIEGLSGLLSALEQPAGPAPATGAPLKRDFRVTELDDYLQCPYDYYVKYILGLGPLEEATEDLSPLDRGSKVHAILQKFYGAWTKPVTAENREEARALLYKLADPAFGREADTVRNRREKELFLKVMAERFLDAEEAFWKQGMRPEYLERKIDHYALVLSDGTEVGLKAKIDRIDVEESGNFIIVDYKTGGYPQPKMKLDQDIFQLPVYAVMALTALSAGSPALKKPVGLAYYDLRGKTAGGARDVVLYDTDATKDQPSAKPKASSKSAEEFEAILKQSMDKARKAVEGILSGDFKAKPQDENKCRYCPNEMMCDQEDL